MILEESLVGSPLVQIVWQRLQYGMITIPTLVHISVPHTFLVRSGVLQNPAYTRRWGEKADYNPLYVQQ